MSGKGFTNIQITSASESEAPEPESGKWAPLTLGFRPFFLLGIWSAVLLMLASLIGFSAGIWHDNYFDLPLWHAHEMVFGYAVAVIAGFLLTSVRNWTGLPTPSGTALALLVLIWLIPRLLSGFSILPGPLFALLDSLFLPLLAVVIGRPILKAKQAQNFPIPLLLLLLGLCNAIIHMEILGKIETAVSSQAMQIAVITIVALITVIAGRVVPFFMQRTIGERPTGNKLVEKLALPSVLLFALTIAIDNGWLMVNAALLTAFIHAVRLFSWFDKNALKEPMLWVLLAGYAGLVAGFILYGLALILDFSTVQAVHAWTLGAIGMFTLGTMTRVALGHTGRPIQALPWIPTAFVLMFIATLSRIFLPVIKPELLDSAIIISATCWIVAFTIIAMRYTSILLRARPDGKAG